MIGSQSTAPLLWPPIQQFGVSLVAGLFPQNGTPVESPAHGIARFELTDDGRIIGIGTGGQVLSEVVVNQEPPAPLHPEMTMREQAIAEEGERAAVAAKHAEAGRERERERQRRNDERENAEFARRQAAISR